MAWRMLRRKVRWELIAEGLVFARAEPRFSLRFFPGISSCSICADICVLHDFHTGLVNLAFPKDHGVKKHFSSGTIGNLAQVYRGDRPKRAASCMPSNHFTIRNFHAGVYMLAWSRKREDVVGLKAPKREKRVKKENRTQPPVEAPYVAPKPKISIKSLLDKTVEIFDGMTLLDLSKRTGAYISTLQGILADLGEKVESEFDSISIDLAELAAMTLLFHGWSNNKPVPWLAATHHQLFNDTLLKLNKELAYLQFELRACMNQYDGMVYYGVVNNIADEESKLGTKYSVPQVAYYKGLLEAVVQEAGNDGTITSIDALNVRLDNQQKREWQHLYRVHERRSCSGWWFTVSLGSPATHGAPSPPAVQFPPAPLFLQASRAAS